jgi:UrcA family protein
MGSNIQSRIPLALAAALLLTCVLGNPNAFADDQVRSELVKFQDLNVNTPEGVKALYGRIHAAAGHVCSESDPLRQPIASACAARAENSVIEKLNISPLSAYYKVKTGTGNQTQPLVAAR